MYSLHKFLIQTYVLTNKFLKTYLQFLYIEIMYIIFFKSAYIFFAYLTIFVDQITFHLAV